MSIIFTDSDCELWFDQLKEYKVKNIEMPYSIDDVQYMYDLGKTTDFKDFFARLRKGAKGTTSALNAEDYKSVFEPVFKKGEDVLYISFSHAMSGTFDQLRSAVKELKETYPDRKVTVFNTKSISCASGLQVIEACKLKNSGASDEEVITFLKDFTQRVSCYFMVDDLMHLKRGGRLSATAAFAGTLLKLKPILTFDEKGSLKVVNKVLGRKSAKNFLVNKFVTDAVAGDYELYILDGDCREETEEMRKAILEKRPELKVKCQTIGPVIGCHCGPNTIGVIYVANNRPIQVIDVDSMVEVL